MSAHWKMERGTLWAVELEASSHTIAQITARIPARLAEISPDDIADIALAMNVSDTESIMKRFRSGRRCFVARVGGDIAAYGWLSKQRECIGELERQIEMQADEAYIWDCFTLPSFRQQRLYSALLVFILQIMQEEAVHRVWIGTGLSNKASLRGFKNAGFHPVIVFNYLRFFKLRLAWVSSKTASLTSFRAAHRALLENYEYALGNLSFGIQAAQACLACLELEI